MYNPMICKFSYLQEIEIYYTFAYAIYIYVYGHITFFIARINRV